MTCLSQHWTGLHRNGHFEIRNPKSEIPVHQVAQLQDDVARREFFADGIRRADRRAAPTLGAGIQIEQVFPGKAARAS